MKIKFIILQLIICLSSFAQTTLDSLIFVEVNNYRQKNGLVQLEFNKKVWIVANHHTNYMVKTGKLEHSENKLKKPSNRMDYYDVTWVYCGENIAVVNPDNKTKKEIALLIMQMWIDSPLHKKVLLSDKPIIGAISSYMGDMWDNYKNTDWLFVTLNTIK